MLVFIALLLTGNTVLSDGSGKNALRSGKDTALFFAINNYDAPTLWPKLQYPIQDAQKIASRLHDLYDFDTVIVRNPTLTEIFETLEVFRKKTYIDDAQLLIFFSGHGEFNEAIKMGYFVPRDVRLNDRFHRGYLEYPTLEREITSIPCKHILLAIDACYSGTFDDAVATKGGGLPGVRPKSGEDPLEVFIEKQLAAKTRRVLTSGAKERTPERSQFAEQFLNALETGSLTASQVLTLTDLYGFLEKANPIPHFSNFKGDEIQSNFLFIAKNLPGDDWTGWSVEFIEQDVSQLMFGLKIPVYHVRNLKLASPAYKAGLQEGDVITAFISPARALADQYSLRAWSREAYSTGHGTIKILRKEAGRYNPIEIKLEKE